MSQFASDKDFLYFFMLKIIVLCAITQVYRVLLHYHAV